MLNNSLKLSEYLNTVFTCTCDKNHSIPIKDILIEENALCSLPSLLSKHDLQKPFLLYDSTTYSVAGERLTSLLAQSAYSCHTYILPCEGPIPDEKTLGEVLIHYERTCDCILAVGSGTINDLSRYISYKLGIPYMIIATAPSMDGFASNVAPLIVKHMKTTYEAQAPLAILGDTNLLKEAPMSMVSAGIGDILGKYTCLCDWKIAHIVTGEYHCEAIEALVRQSLEIVIANTSKAQQRAPEVIKSIMEALVLSGIAMSFAGNSRPASGSEHHLSHYWEMIYLFDGKQPILHGTKVGIATVAVARAYELLMKHNIDFKKAKEAVSGYSKENWENQMRAAYRDAAEAVISLENETEKNHPAQVLHRLTLLEENWDQLKATVSAIPSADILRNTLRSLDAPADPMSVGIDKVTFVNSFIAAKELRNRFGLLQILYDLGLSEEIAKEVWNYFQE